MNAKNTVDLYKDQTRITKQLPKDQEQYSLIQQNDEYFSDEQNSQEQYSNEDSQCNFGGPNNGISSNYNHYPFQAGYFSNEQYFLYEKQQQQQFKQLQRQQQDLQQRQKHKNKKRKIKESQQNQSFEHQEQEDFDQRMIVSSKKTRKSKKHTSIVWNFFTTIQAPLQAQNDNYLHTNLIAYCRICGYQTRRRKNGSTAAMLRHLRLFHSKNLPESIREQQHSQQTYINRELRKQQRQKLNILKKWQKKVKRQERPQNYIPLNIQNIQIVDQNNQMSHNQIKNQQYSGFNFQCDLPNEKYQETIQQFQSTNLSRTGQNYRQTSVLNKSLWVIFAVTFDKTKVLCQICMEMIRRSSNGGNITLKKHLEKKHPDAQWVLRKLQNQGLFKESSFIHKDRKRNPSIPPNINNMNKLYAESFQELRQ